VLDKLLGRRRTQSRLRELETKLHNGTLAEEGLAEYHKLLTELKGTRR
jgi:hypothetical protein